MFNMTHTKKALFSTYQANSWMIDLSLPFIKHFLSMKRNVCDSTEALCPAILYIRSINDEAYTESVVGHRLHCVTKTFDGFGHSFRKQALFKCKRPALNIPTSV